jgi:RHS repeat-associated protein
MHRRFLLSSAVLFCFSLFFASQAFAQIPQPSDTTSVPIPGAGHDYLEGPVETVSPANGSFSIRLPVIMPPSRGANLPFSFMYDSAVYYASALPNGFGWATVGSNGPVSLTLASSGWSFGKPLVSATVARWVEIDPISGTRINCTYTYGYVFQDAAGGRHNLNLTNFSDDHPYHDCQGDPSVTAPSGFQGQVLLQGNEGPIMGSISANVNDDGYVTVTDGDGTVYTFSVGSLLPACGKPPCSIPFFSPLTSLTDRNGNIITVTNPASYKDTSGRTVLQDSGFTISPETLSVSGLGAAYTANWATQPRPTFGSSMQFQTLSGTCYGLGDPVASPSVSSIVLPNGKSYTFAYDTAYDLVNKITYPTGGYARYVWGQNPLSHYGEFTTFNPINVCQMHYSIPAITDRFLSFDGSTEVLHQAFSYSTTWSPSDRTTWTSKTTTVTTTDIVRNKTFTTVYTYTPIPLPLVPGAPDNVMDPHSANPVEVSVAYYDTNGSLLKTVTKTWRNERVLLSQTNTYPTGPANESAWNYDSNEMQIEKDDYDFGTSGVGSLLRKTVTTYASSTTFTANHILDKPSKIQVYDSTGTTLVAETDYAYDTPAATVTSGIVQHSGGCKCGNVTSLSRWVNSSGSTLTSTFTNDDTGQRLSVTDPRGNTTSYSYTDSYSSGTPPGPTNAYVTTVTHPVTNGVNHVEQYAYAYTSGDVTSSTDQNDLVTPYKYVDSLARLTETDFPDGGQTNIAYNDAAYSPSTPSPSVTTTKKINTTTNVVAVSARDGLGHVVRTELTSDPQGTVYSDTVYDGMGRVKSAGNPYRSGTDPTSSPGTTNATYDALGRKTSETAPDGSVITTAYCAGSTLVTDATGRWRRSRTDGLGRLVEVDEPNAVGAIVASTGCPGTGEPIWITSYTLDTLGNLKQVVQNGSHQRTFTYDFLSRLTSANNPETGTISYNYDSDTNCASPNSFAGLLVSKVDNGRNIRSCAKYDALNRETSFSYSNGDPTVATTYDQSGCLGLSSCSNVGHRTSVTDAAGSESWSYQVDATNHRSVHQNQRTTSGVTKGTTYYFDLSGNVTSISYPTGRVVNYTYNSANRAVTAQDSANGITYATAPSSPLTGCPTSAVCYTPQGSIYSMSLGVMSSFTGVNISETFNNRLQPNEIKASSTAGNALDISYNFVDPVSGHNAGHVYSITNNLNSSRSQSFTYDQLNRVVSAGTTATTGSYCWGYQFSYDTWGNLLSQAGWTPTYNACTETTMGAVIADGANHVSALSYDASGNTLSDGNFNYTWNAESQMKTAAGVTYSYDGNGRRAAKVGSKLYWYGSGGEILAETNPSGTTTAEYVFFGGKRVALLPAGSNAQYYVEDFLGSSRIVTQNTGAVCYDADFPPYGQERAYTNSCSQNAYKFEGKERDSETQNDEFGARYYSWRFGRWLSSDWSAVPVAVPYANLTNPQTLNLYAMVAGDPESFADLDGHGDTCNAPNNSCEAKNTPPVAGNTNVLVTQGQKKAVDAKQNAQTAATVAQKEKTVTVTVQQVKAANPFGHVVIKVGGGDTVGLVPNSNKAAAKAVAKEAASAATGTVTPSTVPGHIEQLAPNRVVESTATIQVTPDQARAMQATINQEEAHQQEYDPGFHNCTHFVEQVLRSGGINAPNDRTPGGLVEDLNQQNPH